MSILLFGYGAATAAQAGLMGLIVSVFMLGLVPFTLFYVLLRGYYALEDTRTPFYLTIVFSVILLALAYPLFNLARDGGAQVASLALAYSISYWIGLAITWWVLARRLGSMQSAQTVWTITRLMIAGAVAVGVMFAIMRSLLSLEGRGVESLGHLLLAGNVVATSVAGMAVFAAAAWVLRITEVGDVLSLVTRGHARLRRRSA